jgi:hypothetical protein
MSHAEALELVADAESMRAVFEELLDKARGYKAQLDECHALLFRLAFDDLVSARPVTGAVRVIARGLLERHGIVEPQEER